MGSFFSLIDMNDLHAQTDCYNSFLSVIVNNRLDFVAKIAYKAKSISSTVEYQAKDEQGKSYTIFSENLKQEKIVEIDCSFEFENEKNIVDEEFKTATERIIEEAKKVVYPIQNGFGQNFEQEYSKIPNFQSEPAKTFKQNFHKEKENTIAEMILFESIVGYEPITYFNIAGIIFNTSQTLGDAKTISSRVLSDLSIIIKDSGFTSEREKLAVLKEIVVLLQKYSAHKLVPLTQSLKNIIQKNGSKSQI